MVKNNSDQAMHRAAMREVSRVRRQLAASSPQKFAQCYLGHHFKHAPSAMHTEIFSLLQNMITKRSQRIAIAAPRGHAKSTIVSETFVLWCICYKLENYILLISQTLDQAAAYLSHIKHELETNPLLKQDFPEVCGNLAPDCELRSLPGVRWRKEEIIAPNGVKVTALGAGKNIRGRKHNQYRPGLIILDDMESEEEVRSPDQRKFKLDWFNKAVLKCGYPQTNVVVVGTILHYDSLLAKLINPTAGGIPGWTARKYQAIVNWSPRNDLWEQWENIFCRKEEYQGASGDEAALAFFRGHEQEMLEGTKVLWSEHESYYELLRSRIGDGRASFNSEKQNDPVNPEDCCFQESDIQYWTDQFTTTEALLTALGPNVRIFGACDPSMGKQDRNNDDSAIVTLARAENGILYVLGADIGRRKPDRTMEDIIQYHAVHHYQSFGMEVNQFQEFMADELRARSARVGVYVPVVDIRNSADKRGRIESLQPLVKSGYLKFRRQDVQLIEQMRQFPHGAHDDGLDALQMAVEASKTVPCQLIGISMEPSEQDPDYDPLFDDRLWTPIGSVPMNWEGREMRW